MWPYRSLFFVLGLLPFILCSQSDQNAPIEKRQLFTTKVKGEPPVIDGSAIDECWQQVEWTGDYIRAYFF